MANKRDPLIAAVIAKIPAQGPWKREDRIAWLRMMVLSFDHAYGPVPTIAVDQAAPAQAPHQLASPSGSWTPPAAPAAPRLYIDLDNVVRRAPSDEAILPGQVGGEVLFDKRGEHGDLASITWADGSTGVQGMQLEISAAA